MAVLSESDRAALWADFMRLGGVSITKAELRAALDAADDWVETNSAAYNTALPQPARGSLTSQQKALLLAMVVRRRFDVGA